MKNVVWFCLLLLGLPVAVFPARTTVSEVPPSGRIAEIAQMLPENPQGIGVTYKDRTFWKKTGTDPEMKALMAGINDVVTKGMPPFVDSLYLDLLSSGVRLPGENMLNARFRYLIKLALAECYENKNRFVPAIGAAITELCNQKPWSIPAHDRSLNNYHGKDYYVDLVVATFGNSFAQCVYMLDDKLSPELKKRVQDAFSEKIFRPIRRCIENDSLFYWFKVTNNWNSVCLAGVTGAALALLPDQQERAFFVAAAEKYHTYGLDGYGDDGYCSEGVGYYNYGFRALLTLRETVCRATKGKLDFFATPKFARIARYGERIEIMNKVCPAYSDGRMNLAPDWFITNYCAHALGDPSAAERYVFPSYGNFSLYLIGFFPNQSWMVAEGSRPSVETESPLRSYFDEAGVLICRPAIKSETAIGVSVKSGHNAENHNHNDVGSYAVAIGKEMIAGDAGGPFSYPGDYFNKDCYEKYKTKNSYGHPVPLVNGKGQRPGKKAEGVVTHQEFTDQRDVYQVDLKAAYDCPELSSLQRTFVYSRKGKGEFEVKDDFQYSLPLTFETALITRAQWTKESDRELTLRIGKECVTVWIDASGAVDIIAETIQENAPAYTRIGIRLKDQAKKGYIRLRMNPGK